MHFLQQITNPWVKVHKFQNTEHLCWGYGTGQKLYVMFLAASKVNIWISGLIDNIFLKIDSICLSHTISVKKALHFCEYLIYNISVNYSYKEKRYAEINKTKYLCLVLDLVIVC